MIAADGFRGRSQISDAACQCLDLALTGRWCVGPEVRNPHPLRQYMRARTAAVEPDRRQDQLGQRASA